MSMAAAMGVIRAPFLVLTPVCIAIGVATAIFEQGSVNTLYVLLALLGGLAANVSVNTLNEYFDFHSGLDLKTVKTPFSGGSGALPDNPDAAPMALAIGIASQVVLFLIGLYFVSLHGLALVPLGLLGMLIIVFYTQWITRYPFICLLVPGLSLGPLIVVGTHYVLTGHYSLTALVASLTPFFLVNNLLLLNQIPDIDADKSVGRNHVPIRYGARAASRLFVMQLVCMYAMLIAAVISEQLPLFAMLALLTVFLAIPTARGALENWNNIDKLVPYLGMNVAINIVTPLLVAAGILLSVYI